MAGRIRRSAAEWAATAGARRIRAYEWAGQALLNVLTHHELIPMEPGTFDLLQNRLVRRLAEDAAEHFSMSGIPGASNYHDEIRARLLETLPQMTERPKTVNRRRYLGEVGNPPEQTGNAGTTVVDPSRLAASSSQAIAAGAIRMGLPRLQDPDFWRARRKEFDDLSTRQRSILGDPPHDKWLRAYCGFSQECGEFGNCRIEGGSDGRLISDFEDVATRVACALGCPPAIESVAFWLLNHGVAGVSAHDQGLHGWVNLEQFLQGRPFVQVVHPIQLAGPDHTPSHHADRICSRLRNLR